MRLHLSALGCRLNEAELEALAGAARAGGHDLVDDPADADWALINTCTVTHIAARKSRQAIRQLHRHAPQARLAVMGCYATLSGQEVAALPGVALIIPNTAKAQALQLMEEALPATGSRLSGDGGPAPWRARTRAFVKVQDGCDNHCTYCIVRVARGRSRSRPLPEVLAEVQARVAEGAREVVLSGVNIGAYGRDVEDPGIGSRPSLADLVSALLAQTDVARLRLSSLEPWDVDTALLDLWSDARLCRQLHLPLQSGSDRVLRRMGRPMDSAAYRDLALGVLRRVPEMALSTDLIVGFPGETGDDFEDTLALVREIGLARLHVFRFSPREGTPAALMPGQVPDDVARERAARIGALGRELTLAYQQRFVGRRVEVLFETPVLEAGLPGWSGLTDNYLRVWVPSSENLHNQMREVVCTEMAGPGLTGVLAWPQTGVGRACTAADLSG